MNTIPTTSPPAGTRVELYWNLHKKLWSVRSAQSGLVVAHLRSVCIDRCTFHVSEAGRQRVLASGRKNVHATVRGTIAPPSICGSIQLPSQSVRYNPYRARTFEVNTPGGWVACGVADAVVCVCDNNRPGVVAFGAF